MSVGAKAAALTVPVSSARQATHLTRTEVATSATGTQQAVSNALRSYASPAAPIIHNWQVSAGPYLSESVRPTSQYLYKFSI